MDAGAAEPSADWPWHGRSASFPASLDRYAGLTGPAIKDGFRVPEKGRWLRTPDYVAYTTRREATPLWTSMSTRFAAVA